MSTYAISVPISERKYDWQQVIELRVVHSKAIAWCVALQLLRDNLIDELQIAHGITTLYVSVWPNGRRIHVTKRKDGYTLKISLNQLEAISFFFLEAIRDGHAAVDHIDIEASKEGLPIDVMIATDLVGPAASHEDLMRQIEM